MFKIIKEKSRKGLGYRLYNLHPLSEFLQNSLVNTSVRVIMS